jgi:GTP-binding protein HflX
LRIGSPYGGTQIPVLKGNLLGLSHAEKHGLERLFRRRVPPRSIISNDLAREMASLSHALNRRIGLLVDRSGRVEAISVGGATELDVPRKPSAPSGRMRFCTLRYLATRFQDGPLTSNDLAPLALHRLDVLAMVEVEEGGSPGPVRVAHLLPAPERLKPSTRRPVAPVLPRGAIVPKARGKSPRRGRPDQIEDIASDGERYRLFPPCAAPQLTDDFLQLIRALEREFERYRARTKVATAVGRAILVHVTIGDRASAEASMDELEELADSINLQVTERIVQRLKSYNPRTLMGSGKLQDLIIHALRVQADFIVVDQNLTPAQARAIAEATDLKVIDRTQLILDIFANRARTREGKIQVELAQLKYLLPRLMSRGDTGMSRLEGGIGGRGPGEQKLEIDRRRVRDRLKSLERMLRAERKRREQRRSRRRARNVPVISLVGYTNAGKSTLLNLLTQSEVFVERRMFATLDPTSRRLRLPREREVIINDTVGFIRDLPADLLEAFRATLEEIEDSDLIIHLVDISHPGYRAQVTAVNKIMHDLDYADIPSLVVYNKIDVLDRDELATILAGSDGLPISATRKKGIDTLLNKIETALPPRARLNSFDAAGD